MSYTKQGDEEQEINPEAKPRYDVEIEGSGSKKPRWCTRKAAVGALFLVVICIAVIIAAAASQKKKEPTPAPIWETLRLPASIIPHHYLVKLQIDLTRLSYNGTVEADYELTEETSVLVIHSLGLDITSAVNKPANGGENQPSNTFVYEANQFFVLEFGEAIAVGRHKLVLDFKAPLENNLAGLYASSYKDSKGETRYLATTQFEPTDARRAFPCWDEPAKKANFTIHIVCEDKYHALSNMPVQQQVPAAPGWTEFHFATSLKMSTYLVAIVVSDFQAKTTTTSQGVRVSVWAAPEKVGLVDLALEAAAAILEYYEKYYNVPYPLPKQDMIAIPDFSAGAMENWGLITYRETALLYNNITDSAGNAERVLTVVAHELAHQWFGNLVTMDWWNELWLNEGFAAYVEFVGADVFRPSWKMWDQFPFFTQEAALALDSTAASHPVLVEVSNPDEINEIFDSISYDKGSSLLRMIVDWIGEAAFRKGVESYLNSLAFGNANSKALWKALGEAAPTVAVGEIMEGWTTQAGYPLVTVQYLDETKVGVTQKHFRLNASQADSRKWHLQISVLTEKGRNEVHPLLPTQAELQINYKPESDGWLLLNKEHIGYYRVQYPPAYWNRLADALYKAGATGSLESFPITIQSRQGLLADAFALVQAGELTVDVAMNLTKFLEFESDYTVWSAGLASLDLYGRYLREHPLYSKYQTYLQRILTPIYQQLGWNATLEDPHNYQLIRSTILSASARYSVLDARAQAKAIFNDFMAGRISSVPGAIAAIVYNVGVSDGGSAEWEFMYRRYKDPTLSASEISRCLVALTQASRHDLLALILDYSLDSTKVRLQDLVSVVSNVARNVHGQALAWDFLRQNWEKLYNALSVSMNFGGVVNAVVSGFSSELKYEEVETFFKGRNVGSAAQGLQKAKENIVVNQLWFSRNIDALSGWLESF